MFYTATSFDQSLNSWNTSSLKNAYSASQCVIALFDTITQNCLVCVRTGGFMGARSFNQPIKSWDVSSVTTTNRAPTCL